MVALSCRFALDMFTVAQQDGPHPEPDLLAHDPEHELCLWVVAPAGVLAGQHGWTCILVAFLLLPAGLLKVGSPSACTIRGSPGSDGSSAEKLSIDLKFQSWGHSN